MSQVSVPLKYIYGSHRNANESFAEKREIKKKRCWARGSVYTLGGRCTDLTNEHVHRLSCLNR